MVEWHAYPLPPAIQTSSITVLDSGLSVSVRDTHRCPPPMTESMKPSILPAMLKPLPQLPFGNNSRPPGSPPSPRPRSERATRAHNLDYLVPAFPLCQRVAACTFMHGPRRCRYQAPFRPPQRSRPTLPSASHQYYYRFGPSTHAISHSGRLHVIAWGIHQNDSSSGEGGGMWDGPVAVPTMIMLPSGRSTPAAPQRWSGPPEIGFDAPLSPTAAS